MEDTTDSSHFDLIRMFLEQTKVDTCLVSSRSEEDLILFCQDFMELSGGEPDDSGGAGNSISPRNITGFVDSRRNVENDPNAQQLFTSIRLLNFGGDQAPFLSSTAALLEQLPRTRSAEELDETQSHLGALHINSIEILSLDQIMQVNADALAPKKAILCFSCSITPRLIWEDLYCEDGAPTFLIDNNHYARHAAIQCFLLPENMSAASTIRANLRGLCQMPKTMALLRTGRGRLPEWRGVAKFAYHVNLLKDAVRELSDYENIGAVNQVRVIPKIIAQVLKNEKLLKALDEVNTEMGALVNSVIDWEESQTNQRVCISPGIDEALDEKKRVYNGLDDLLLQSAFMIDLAQVSLALRNCTARSLIILDEFGKGSLSTGSVLAFAWIPMQHNVLERTNKNVIERARFVSTILSHNEIGVLLDEGMSEEQVEELEAHAAICQRFISWKMSPGDNMGTKGRLREVLKK
ncbi:DNA mismatch repair protein MutS [Rhizoctonia solani]|uniref:DNA mismatch repair protein MutS n=1 Tax=Rhizoctonia solani TaxID=456999 RepID=A0A8H8P7W3_9AGAM|nr:DNA mismatch repair protein MutS [Rhizoctonia solani]QRW25461.1 DNA mismatch repair protein MutS [Rhizoctonia solani]